jgi:superfamily II DNA or RNA helicase
MISLAHEYADQVKADLTKSIYNFQNPQKPKKVQFYQLGERHTYLVPRYYAFSILGKHANPVSYSHQVMNDMAEFTCDLYETKERPQQSIVSAAIEQLKRERGATIVAGCGTGKTNMAIAIALKMKLRVAVVCHQSLLVDQWRERIDSFTSNVVVGTIRRDECTMGDIVLCSLQSLLVRDYPEEALEFGLVIVDETHHIIAKTFSKILDRLKYDYTLGLTATPKRKDGLEQMIYYMVGAPCFKLATREQPNVVVSLVRTGVKHKEIVNRNGVVGFSTMVTNLTQDPVRNAQLMKVIAALQLIRPNSQGLLLSDRVTHLKDLYAALPDQSMAEIVTGAFTTKPKIKPKPKKRVFEFTTALTLSTFKLFSEAIDFPGDYIILATPRSSIQQSTGRIMRGKNPNIAPLIIDFVDNFSLFTNMSKKRQQYYKKHKYAMFDEFV